MNDFEELAHRSSDAIRTSVDTDAIPDFRGPANRAPMIVAAVVLVAALIGGAGWFAARDGDDVVTDRADQSPEASTEDDDATEGSEEGGEVGPLYFEWTESGSLEVVVAVDVPASGPGTPEAVTTVYGEEGATLPLPTGDLMVAVFEGEDGSIEFSGEEIEVRGQVGYLDETLDEFGFDVTIGWQEEGDTNVVFASRSMTIAELVSLAEGSTFTGLDADLPTTLVPLIEIPGLPFGRLGAGGWSLVYENPDAEPEAGNQGVAIFAREAPPESRAMQQYLFADGSLVDIRGKAGWLAEMSSGVGMPGSQTALWWERGRLISVSAGEGIDVVAVANSLEEIDLERWAELADTGGAAQSFPDAELLAEGPVVVEGANWSWGLFLEVESLCFSLDTVGASSSACSGQAGEDAVAPNTLALSGWSTTNGALEVWGQAPAGTERLVLERGDGSAADLPIFTGDTRPGLFFGLAEAVIDGPYTLTAFGSDGEVIDVVSRPPEGTTFELPSGLVASGQEEDVMWELTSNGTEICLSIELTSAGSGTCSANGVAVVDIDNTLYLGGRVEECVAGVALRSNGEETLLISAAAARTFFASVPSTSTDVALVFTRSDGTTIVEIDPMGSGAMSEVGC